LRRGAKVLLVEDSRATATRLTARIDGIDGVACTHGATCADAQSLLREDAGRFFLAVLDLNLPDAPDGEVIGLVGDYGIPIDVSTGNLDEAVRARLFARGVADYVVKDSRVGIGYIARLVSRMAHSHQSACCDNTATRALQSPMAGPDSRP
jgi:DNA-binding response OmpR family regulator